MLKSRLFFALLISLIGLTSYLVVTAQTPNAITTTLANHPELALAAWSPQQSVEQNTPALQTTVPISRPQVCPADTASITSVLLDPASQEFPDVDDNRVVWQDFRTGPTDIFMKELATGAITNLTKTGTWEVLPDLDGDIVVWKDGYKRIGIHGLDLRSNRPFTVTEDHSDVSAPRLSGNIVVWADNRAGGEDWNIYGYNLATQSEFVISEALGRQQDPQIDGNYVVWWDDQEQIYLYDIATQVTQTVHANRGARLPAVSAADQLVVWQDYRNGNWDIYGYDLLTQQEVTILIAPRHQERVAIANGLLVFQSQIATSSWNIQLIPRSGGTPFPITNNPNPQVRPRIAGDLIVWQDSRNHQTDIYFHRWDGAPDLACENEPFGLQVGALPEQQILLQWQDVVTDELGFRLERATGITGTTWLSLTTLPANSTIYTDTPDELGQSYWYRLIAFDTQSDLAYSIESYSSTFYNAPSPDELYLMTLINEARADPAKFGYLAYPPVPPLLYQPLVAYSARAHSQGILNSGYQIGHCDAIGRCPTERVRAVNYAYNCGENLVATVGNEQDSTGAKAMEQANQMFLDSEGHRNNMLAADLREMGVGHTFDLGKGVSSFHGQVTEVLCGGDPNRALPALPLGVVAPSVGLSQTIFTYTVSFYSAEGQAPQRALVYIDQQPYSMTLSSGRPAHGTYRYAGKLPAGTEHEYYFWFEYGAGSTARWPENGAENYPDVYASAIPTITITPRPKDTSTPIATPSPTETPSNTATPPASQGRGRVYLPLIER